MMSSQYLGLKHLVGVDLTDSSFQVLEMTEVYKTNEDGRRVSSVGFFKKEKIAKAFAGIQVDANYHETRPVFVLTNGLVGYAINDKEPVSLFDDEEEMLKIREKILSKLSPEEHHILGIKK